MTSTDDYDEIAELEAEGCLIQHDVENVAIFANSRGDIVVKEIVHAFPRGCDTSIIIARANAFAAAKAILVAAGFSLREADMMASRPDIRWETVLADFSRSQAAADDDEEQPKDRTAAERQRRRRAKQRDSRDNDRDTNRDSVTAQEPLRLVAAE